MSVKFDPLKYKPISRNPASFRSAKKPNVTFTTNPQLASTFIKSQKPKAVNNQQLETKSVGSNKPSSTSAKKITFAADNKQGGDYNVTDNSMSNLIKNVLMRQQSKRVRSTQATSRRRTDDMSYAVREAQYYFEKNPTYLKEIEVGEEQKNLDLQKYVANIGIKRNPIFGFPHIQYEENESPETKMGKQSMFTECLIGQSGVKPKKIDFKDERRFDSDDDESNQASKIKLPFRDALNQKRKDDRIYQHVYFRMKCFTFGKKVKRQLEDDSEKVSRVQILKKRFQRLSILREYFSVTKRDQPRKFKYPICEDANQAGGKPLDIYDELQYCEESDVEECMRPSPLKKKQNIPEPDLEEKSFSLDLDLLEDQNSRLDIKIMNKLKLRRSQQLQENLEDESDTDTFKDLSDTNSLHSSPRYRTSEQMMAYDRLMPFDFHTHRKAKGFFKEKVQDVDCLLQNYENSLKQDQQLQFNKDKVQFDENEDANLRELPERNEYLKQMYQLRPSPINLVPNRKQRKTAIKASQENIQTLDNYNYTAKVQANQVRNNYNDLKQLIFTRSQSKNLKQKRQLLHQVVSFKQRISPLQIEALKARQFVIVDVAITPPNGQQQSPNKKRVREEDVFRGKDAQQIQMVKHKIMQSKDKMMQMGREQKASLSSFQNIPIKNQRQALNTKSQMMTAASVTPHILKTQVSSDILRNINSRNYLFETPGQSSLSSILPAKIISNRPTDNDQIVEEQEACKQPKAKGDYQSFINDSPYIDILCPPHNFGIGSNGRQTMGQYQQQHKIRKFMAEKLRRRSILNCELFKETSRNESKAKTMYMTERIGEILGIKIGNNMVPYQQQPLTKDRNRQAQAMQMMI